ncbi:hypothetical protein BGZ82_004919 [Podila clonocystis]|nr:hypothetical protein BGZ82_004919 [Podila clonocystis]
MAFTTTYRDGSKPDIAIIGAGLSGICAAIQLQCQLTLSTTIFESEAEIGGTWAVNTYPGCGSDDRSYLYSYSFAPNYDWSRKYVSRTEILEYLRMTASRFGLFTHHNVLLSHRVTNVHWDDSLQRWRLEWVNTLTGEQGVQEADIVVHGTGLYKTPRIPRLFNAFKGEKWHSARWNHSVDLTGKRVGVVGSSASAIQLVPAIVDRVDSLFVYGRSPVYISPQFDSPFSETTKALFHRFPRVHLVYVLIWTFIMDSTYLLYYRLTWYSAFHRGFLYVVTWLHRLIQVPDPALRAKLVPDQLLGSKRTALSNAYYPALGRDHVEYFKEEIVEVHEQAITTDNGSTREMDVLILATGFDIPCNFPNGQWIGRGGVDIAGEWIDQGGAFTFYGVMTPKAPNFFMIWGPQSGSYHQAITGDIEAQVMFMVRSLSFMMTNELSAIEVTEHAAGEYMDLVFERRALAVSCAAPSPISTGRETRGDYEEKTTEQQPFIQKRVSVGTGPCFWNGSCAEFRRRLQHVDMGQVFDSLNR